MSDFMRWMYDHYIKPNIESQPKDEGEALQIREGLRVTGEENLARLLADFMS